ncbi:hypothetical protein PFISCL1PPCAC_20223, partial [Pristionchus fissidentatus]
RSLLSPRYFPDNFQFETGLCLNLFLENMNAAMKAAVDMLWFDTFIEKMMTAMPEIRPPKDPYAPLINVNVSLDEVSTVTRRCALAFKEQKSMLRIDKAHLPIYIVGDLHGQFRELRIMLSRCGDPMNQSYLFLGDYVDRGVQGVESIMLILALKVRYPDRVFMLRGNHEDCNTATAYGFYDECLNKFAPNGEAAWTHFVNVFNWMPVCALVAEKIICMHGGISPHITDLATIENLPRPSIIPPYGLMCDLLWSDPDNKYPGWALSGRGISFTFDDNLIKSFCETFNIDLIVRAHQISNEMKGGYKFYCEGRLVSIFSAPNYLNMFNDACVIRVNKDLVCRFLVFKSKKTKPGNKSNRATTNVEEST